MDADGGDFGFGRARFASLDGRGGRPHMSIFAYGIRPDARQAPHVFRGKWEISAGADQYFFEAADEFHGPERFALAVGSGKSAEVEDGITYDLSGAVEGYVAAAVAFEDLDAALGKQFRRRDHVFRFRVAAERDHGRVLEQEQNIADLLLLTQSDQLLLQAQARGVIDGAELD